MNGQDIVDAARQYIGTPWRHAGRGRDGCDCVGLILAVCGDLGLRRPALRYRPLPDLALFDLLPLYAERVEDYQPGDVARFTVAGRPQHLGILAEHPQGGTSLIHANKTAGKVCEHRLDSKWARRMVSVWRVRF